MGPPGMGQNNSPDTPEPAPTRDEGGDSRAPPACSVSTGQLGGDGFAKAGSGRVGKRRLFGMMRLAPAFICSSWHPTVI